MSGVVSRNLVEEMYEEEQLFDITKECFTNLCTLQMSDLLPHCSAKGKTDCRATRCSTHEVYKRFRRIPAPTQTHVGRMSLVMTSDSFAQLKSGPR